MQEQAHLHALGEARYRLFVEFCLPSMVHQSSQDFLWIIKIDPDLSPDLLGRLIQSVQQATSSTGHARNNIYLVASRRNFRTHPKYPGAWRDGAALEDLYQSRIYTGDVRLLQTSMALVPHKLLLETRLDADDGLHMDYLMEIQQQAISLWSPGQQGDDDDDNNGHNPKSTTPTWMYWCARRNLEWHWVPPKDSNIVQNVDYRAGALTPIVHEKLCVTPGITTAFPVGTREADVPILPHDKLVTHIGDFSCGMSDDSAPKDASSFSSPCLRFVEHHTFEAVRSRTPTSTGMLEVVLSRQELLRASKTQDILQDVLEEDFGIQMDGDHLASLNEYLTNHLVEIARDNLQGQCKTGHSCKESAKKALKELIGVSLDD